MTSYLLWVLRQGIYPQFLHHNIELIIIYREVLTTRCEDTYSAPGMGPGS